MERTLSTHEVARMLRLNIKTIQRWDCEGQLNPADGLAAGRRYDSKDQNLRFPHQRSRMSRIRKMVAYCRVSNLKGLRPVTEDVKADDRAPIV